MTPGAVIPAQLDAFGGGAYHCQRVIGRIVVFEGLGRVCGTRVGGSAEDKGVGRGPVRGGTAPEGVVQGVAYDDFLPHGRARGTAASVGEEELLRGGDAVAAWDRIVFGAVFRIDEGGLHFDVALF